MKNETQRSRPENTISQVAAYTTNMNGTSPTLLTVDEVCKLTLLTKSTMYSLLSNGRGPISLKIGRSLRFRETDVIAWRDENHSVAPRIEKVMTTTHAAMPTLPQLLSLDDLVELTKIPKSTIYNLLSRGDGPVSLTIGRSLRFRPADIDTWFERLETKRAS